MTPELHKAFNALADLCELAQHDHEKVEAVIHKFDEIAAMFSRDAERLKRTVTDEMKAVLPVLAGQAAKTAAAQVVKEVAGANLAAEKARVAFERAARFSVVKICALGLGIVTIAVVALVILARFLVPTWSDIEERRAEEVRLQRSITALKSQYPDLDLSQCDRRPCVRTDPAIGGYGQDRSYRILYGH